MPPFTNCVQKPKMLLEQSIARMVGPVKERHKINKERKKEKKVRASTAADSCLMIAQFYW